MILPTDRVETDRAEADRVETDREVSQLPEDAARARLYSPSVAQEPVWFLQELEPHNTAYNMAFTLRLLGRLDVAALENSIGETIRRHDILRARFVSVEGRLALSIVAGRGFVLETKQLAHLSLTEREAALAGAVSFDARRPFNLERGPPYRFTLLMLGETEHVLAFVFHHTVFDGTSLGVLFRELSTHYRAFSRGAVRVEAPVSIQYADYALEQRRRLEGAAFETALSCWTEELEGAPPVLELPADHPRPPEQSFRGAVLRATYTAEVLCRLRSLAGVEQATMFMTILAAFKALLFRYTGQEDVIVGSPFADRVRPSTRGIIGMCVNSLVLRSDLSGSPSFRSLLQRVKQTCLGAFKKHEVPFSRVVEALRPERSKSHHPVFQVMFIQQAPVVLPDFPGLEVRFDDIDVGASKFDLTLSVLDDRDGIHAWFEYNTDLFEEPTILTMARSFGCLLESIALEPDLPIGSLRLAPKEDRSFALFGPADLSPKPCFTELFARQADATPSATAVVFEGRSLTYSELEHRSNQLAWRLRAAGIGPGKLAGVLTSRSLDMVVALLGIMKAGAAYVPLDAAYPKDRIRFMLEDSGIEAVITEEAIGCTLGVDLGRAICVDRDRAEIAALSSVALPRAASAESLAYVIYTSGSTGRPKGVEIEHAALSNLLLSMAERTGFSARDRLLAVTTISFDIAALELYLPLISGGRAIIASREAALDGSSLAALIEREGITVMQATPATWRLLLDSGWKGRVKVLSGGEALPNDLARRLLERAAGSAVEPIFNLYGPTETTIWSAANVVTEKDLALGGAAGCVSLGTPLMNTSLFVLGRDLQPVPRGVIGELFIGGRGLACGYRGRPELTATRFLPNPFVEEPGARMYRTGDLVRVGPSGALEFLGRTDDQVKLRGHRIELGEIKKVLEEHSAVREAEIVLSQDRLRLIGYVSRRGEETATAKELAAHLRGRLPEYMVPAQILFLDALPRAPGGKIDRRALPAPKVAIPRLGPAAFATTPIELQLTMIWERLLGVRGVGLTDNFFELGGHSFLAVRLADEIEKAFGKELPVIAVFRAPTVSELAALLASDGVSSPWRALEPLQTRGTRRPLFFVGSTGFARPLLPFLGPKQPVYGLNVFGLDPPSGEVRSIGVRGVAERYVREVRKIEPHGPYRLCGYCQDAKVALEMALLLKDQGEEIELLAYIDVVWPVIGRDSETRRFFENTRDYGSKFFLPALAGRLHFHKSKRVTQLRRLTERLLRSFGRSGSTVLRHSRILSSFYEALDEYSPPTYPGDIVLFLARDFFASDAAEQLASLASGSIEVIEVGGYHAGLFEPPAVELLGERMRACLEDLG